ncbi:MAG: pentapeptide repeat-containing protein, partial [Erysipelotrichaceae bacterium]|nr:pentapeptide repeat-containing protein [Erysipelotrichaceae bacterium]
VKLPAVLEEGSEEDLQDSVRAMAFSHITVGKDVFRKEWNEVVMEDCNWMDGTMESVDFVDMEAVHCVFPTAKQEKCLARRVHIVRSKCMGWQWEESSLQDVVFEDCNLSYGGFTSCKLSHVVFKNCKLANSVWYQNSLNDVTFIDCDLTNADFYMTKLKGADLSTCNLEGLRSDWASVEGIQIHLSQCEQFCRMMGFTVK